VEPYNHGAGTDRCPPWLIERVIRDAREKIDGLPEDFSFDLLAEVQRADIAGIREMPRHQLGIAVSRTSGRDDETRVVTSQLSHRMLNQRL